MAGIAVAVVGVISIFSYCLNLMATGQSVRGEPVVLDWAGLFGHIGVAMFIFEGNAVVINIKAETRNQQVYSKILVLSIATCVTVFLVFATVCYLTYK